MNRRQFTATLAALPVTNLLPLPLTAASAPQSVSVPAGTYAWARLIARAQNRCTPAMLARHLRLDPATAGQLFDEMIRDGVLRVPGPAGIAKAVQPMNPTGRPMPSLSESVSKLGDLFPGEEPVDQPTPLVKDAEPCLGCGNLSAEDHADAGQTQSIQESPPTG
ncbi:MAG: hypothetical protein HKP51_06360 [Sulfitobacter sp.]|nr:hypothetical protein [Sulfitobacter sp.]